MNEQEKKEFMDAGKFMGHFFIYNRKKKQFIDTSNNCIFIKNEEEELEKFNDRYNRMYRMYLFPLHYLIKQRRKDVGKFCVETVGPEQISKTKTLKETRNTMD